MREACRKAAWIMIVPLMLVALVALGGCGSRGGSALLGGAAGAAAGAGGYEYHLNRERERVQQDYKEGKIDRKEYEIRIDQIERDSLVQ